ncbi:hypothetical protein C2G38_2205070 [Gigaspora rosea]|uniref:Uncharacterized protein n=1 Tax=Gigaspora rosea TaxID=44941 RepID=A0A397UMW1_9GLOM|nr:hypothetical protein C2G38_2205070 [Gigaspora rosea]
MSMIIISCRKALGDALYKNTSVTNFDLSYNELDELAEKAICKNTTLTNLNLESNNLGESARKA